MRYLLSVSLFSLIASGAMAGDFTLDSDVSAVTVYGLGATITRSMAFDVPAGQHRLTISDIPYEFAQQTLQFMGGEGLVINASQIVSQRPELDGQQIDRREELETKIDSLNAQIRIKQEESAAAGLITNAASARIKLLDSIGGQQAQSAAGALEAQTISAETLTALVALVGSETLSALQDAQAARTEIAAINRDIQEIQKDLQKTQEELARLVEPSDWSEAVSLQVSAETAVSGALHMSYVVGQAGWHPVYRFMLNTEAETLAVKRSVTVTQRTNENWENAEITVSTATPYSGGRFYMPNSNIARYEAPPPPVNLRANANSSDMQFAAPEVMAIEEPSRTAGARVNFQGITATYTLPAGTIVTGDSQETTVALSENSFEVGLSARASMGSDAFVSAEWVNTSGEPFLPGTATFFRDGAFVSDDEVEIVAAGATSTLGFGKINGIEVKRTTLRREDGSSGVLTTANDRVVEYELSVENVSNRAWDVILYDRVPVSEQEELIVDWSARPRPTEADAEGRRGVLAWEFALESGASKVIKLSYELQWPEGHELRVQP